MYYSIEMGHGVDEKSSEMVTNALQRMNDPEFWTGFRVKWGGPEWARKIPEQTHETLRAKSADEFGYAYTSPNGNVVVPGIDSPGGIVVEQRIVSEAAEPFVEYCLLLIESGVGTDYGAGVLMGIVADIVGGEPSREEIEAGNADLVERCLCIVGEHVELLYTLAESEDEKVVFDVVEVIARLDDKDQRLLDLVASVRKRELRQMNPGSHRNFHFMLDQIRDGTSGLSD